MGTAVKLYATSITMFCHENAPEVAAKMKLAADRLTGHRYLKFHQIWYIVDTVYCLSTHGAIGTSAHENRKAMRRLAHEAGIDVPLEAVILRQKISLETYPPGD